MRFFTSDRHFYHANVIKYCDGPFSSLEEMNEMLVLYWNQVVGPDDEIFVIGDFSMAFRPVELFTRRLNGVKHLVAGNHDFYHPAHKKSRSKENQEKWIAAYLNNGWASVKYEDFVEIGGQKYRLAHMPYRSQTDEDQRHQKHRVVDDGVPLLCGHAHEKWKSQFTSLGTLMVNVGVDVWNYRPVVEDDFAKYLDGVRSGR